MSILMEVNKISGSPTLIMKDGYKSLDYSEKFLGFILSARESQKTILLPEGLLCSRDIVCVLEKDV